MGKVLDLCIKRGHATEFLKFPISSPKVNMQINKHYIRLLTCQILKNVLKLFAILLLYINIKHSTWTWAQACKLTNNPQFLIKTDTRTHTKNNLA